MPDFQAYCFIYGNYSSLHSGEVRGDFGDLNGEYQDFIVMSGGSSLISRKIIGGNGVSSGILAVKF